jgi:two-component system, OmpR family, phosphate regulon sensor histidine kinase PhoR
MRANVSLRTVLLLSFWGLLAVTVILPLSYTYNRLHGAVAEELKQDLLRPLNLVASLMIEQEAFQNAEQLQSWIVEISKPLELRLTYVAYNGQVLADSQFPFEQVKDLEDFSARPEIAQAMVQEFGFMRRFSRIMHKKQVFAARRIEPKGNIPAGVLRVAAPVSELQDLFVRLRNLFLFSAPFLFVIAAVLSFLLVRKLKEAMRSVTLVVAAIGEGNYRGRIHFPPGHELYPLSNAVNQTAEFTGRRFGALRAQQQELTAVFNAMREGVMVLDETGRIRSVNQALSELLGTRTEVGGRRPLEVLLSLELQQACDRILASPDPLQEAPYYLPILMGDGRTFEVNIVRLQEQEKEMGAVVVFHDMSRLKQLEKVRQDFVANVSHELRTPLTSIKGYTETLLAEPQPKAEVLSSFLEVILKNTNHMVKMVEDLLQLAKIEAGQETIKLLPVNPTEALMAAWKACLPLAEAKNLSLANNLPSPLVGVAADFDQLIRVFRNLLENGIRYSPEGGTIAVDGHAEGNTVTIRVRNDGPSIPRYHRQRIFERFYRIEKSRGSDLGNTGLGLAICRHIILNHGGMIWVRSPNPGRTDGATFFFTLVSAQEQQAVVGGQ